MSAASRRKGAANEAALVTFLRANGWPHAERRMNGNPGPDVTGCPGIAWEAKNAKAIDLAGWVDQAEEQRILAGADYAPVVIKRRGRADLGQAYGVLPLGQLCRLLAEAGRAAPDQKDQPMSIDQEAALPKAPLPPPRWQLRLTNGDLIAGDYEWMDGGTDPDRIDWDPVEGYLEAGEAAEAWWMVPTVVVAAPLPQPGEDEEPTS